MAVGLFRSDDDWVQVDYGTSNIPIPRQTYELNGFKPDFEKLPTEAEYKTAQKQVGAGAKAKLRSIPPT